MKSIFIIACTITGLLLLYFALIEVVGIAGSFMLYDSPESRNPILVMQIMSFLLQLGMGLFLLFGTKKLFNKMPDESQEILAIPFSKILRLGIILLGLYFFMSNLPGYVNIIHGIIFDYKSFNNSYGITKLTVSGVVLIQSFFLIFGSDKITNVLVKHNYINTGNDRYDK